VTLILWCHKRKKLQYQFSRSSHLQSHLRISLSSVNSPFLFPQQICNRGLLFPYSFDQYIYTAPLLFSHGATAPSGSRPPHYRCFTITFRHTAHVRTPLDEWSARHRDVYLTTCKTGDRQPSMPPAAFEPAIAASKRL